MIRSHRFAPVLALVVWMSVFDAGVAAADEAPPPTNLDLMTELTSEIATELIERLNAEFGNRPVRLKPFSATEEYQFITNVFTNVLSEKGVRTFQPGAEPAGGNGADAVVLEYQALEFALAYAKVYRSHLVGGKRVKREAGVRILTTLTSPTDGEVLWIGDASRDSSDQFKYGDVTAVEKGEYQFTRPEIPSSGWGKVVEPVFVTGIIVGLIYLFFSNQSDS